MQQSHFITFRGAFQFLLSQRDLAAPSGPSPQFGIIKNFLISSRAFFVKQNLFYWGRGLDYLPEAANMIRIGIAITNVRSKAAQGATHHNIA